MATKVTKATKATEVFKSKRFVIRKGLLGKNAVVEFTTKKGDVYKYNHDEVYKANQEKLEAMPCFQKYKSYTATNNVPSFAKDFVIE